MTAYFYFIMSAHFWAWDWYLLIPDFSPIQRAFLTLFSTLFLLIDLVAIYEAYKTKNKTRNK